MVFIEKKIIECQETIGETNTMKHEEFKFFRFFHFLIQMMWGKKWYYYFLIFLKRQYSIHPVDFIEEMVNNLPNEKGKLRDLYDDFIKDYTQAECFENENDLINFWRKSENFTRLEDGEYGKLNMLYTYKVVLNTRKEFSDYLIKISKNFKTKKNINKNNFIKEIKEVLKFQNCKLINFDENAKYNNEIFEKFEFDFIKWINTKYKKLESLQNKKTFRFYMPENKILVLDKQFKNNKGKI